MNRLLVLVTGIVLTGLTVAEASRWYDTDRQQRQIDQQANKIQDLQEECWRLHKKVYHLETTDQAN